METSSSTGKSLRDGMTNSRGGHDQQLQCLPLTQLFTEPSIALCPQPSCQVKHVFTEKSVTAIT